MNIYFNKRITIIGFGITGISCFKFFKSKKSNIFILDNNEKLNVNKFKLDKKKINLKYLDLSWILLSNIIVVSPGVDINKIPELLIAKKYNIDIVNDIEIFFREINNINYKIILITGSNAKSSITTMIYKILKKKFKVFIGGNIGIPILNSIKKKYDYYVIEISSFQLEIISNIKSFISVITNISSNHIDRHKNMYNYINIKNKVYLNSLNCIFNINDLNTYKYINNFNKNCKKFSFGYKYGKCHLIKEVNDYYIIYNKNKINCNIFKIKSMYFYINILVVILVTSLLKIKIIDILDVLKKFNGIKHRCNIIKHNNNIKWINDSKSTNQNSTIFSINSINKYNYIHLLIGGYSKLNNMSVLSQYIKYKNIILYLYGIDGLKLLELFYNFSIYRKKMTQLLFIIKNNVKKGDIVLLSPSCSSKDQYKSFEERGYDFIKFVKNNI